MLEIGILSFLHRVEIKVDNFIEVSSNDSGDLMKLLEIKLSVFDESGK